ncbi:hypothetical protein, partial [Hyella patelloides]|uniref:hypothetical protein n=1 Tax=Hyella patelloides TaxID=1982969 RepID=UPI001C9740A3
DLANECATAKPSPLGVLGGAYKFCRETTESAPWVSLNEQLVQDSNDREIRRGFLALKNRGVDTWMLRFGASKL